ncbi:MAG: hypothetical protein KJZ69_19050 [Phycisphaerales bacterium]|nr:hypothetical protein [Phycisphaerales bacterium]
MARTKTPTRSTVSPPENPSSSSIEITASAQIDVEAAAGEGTAALPRFKMVAYTGGAMRVAAWRHPVILDLAGLNIPSQQRPIRFSHDPGSGVGHTDTIRIEQGQLIASGLVSRDTPTAREIVTSSKNGFPWQASVGASVEDFEFIREGQKVLVNGQEFAGPVNVVRKATLGEISFVDLGADGKTSVNVAAIASTQENVMDSDTKDNGTASNNGTVTQTKPEATQDDPSKVNASAIEDIRAQALAETSRIAAVRRLCAGQHDEIEAKAIREGWDATRTELEILRANRPKAPAIHVHDQNVSTQVLEAACMLTAGLDEPEKHCQEQALDLAAKRFRGGIGLQELLLEAAWANGYSGRNFRDSRNVLKFAFNPGIEAGLSTIDIGGILSNVANKFLLEGFFSVERTWRNITAVRNVSDFKTVTSYRLIGKDQYEVVAPGGELKHGTLGEEQYTNKADTYGLLLSIDRRDIINDDLGAITTVPRKLGRGSGLKINDVFWTIFLANSDFFKVGNKNFISGADTALTIDGLTKGEVTFMDQVDGDGKPIGVMPAILLVPTALSAIGTQLFKSMELRDTTASTKYPVSNPHQGKFRVEVSRYLSNAQYTGNSAKAWYLLADPADLPVIEVAFLNGQESPTIETAEADFNVLGIQMRGYHDFGCALQDPRGGTKSKGEA